MKMIKFYSTALSVVLLALLLIGMSPQKVRADLITFDFSGTVDWVGIPLEDDFSIGQTISGSYTFDSTTPNTWTTDPNTGAYESTLTAVTVSVDGYSAALAPLLYNYIQVSNDAFTPPGDIYRVFAGLTGLPGTGHSGVDRLVINLIEESTLTALDSISLPLTPPDISYFSDKFWQMYFNNSEDVIGGYLTSLTLAPIPEPSSLLLLGTGLLGFAGIARRRKN